VPNLRPSNDEMPSLGEAEIEAEFYALEVLESARVLVDQALRGDRETEAVINWLWTYSSNARITYHCAGRAV